MESFNEYLDIVKNTSVTVCPKCGSHNTTNYNFCDNANCFDCGYVQYDTKFKYKTIGMMS